MTNIVSLNKKSPHSIRKERDDLNRIRELCREMAPAAINELGRIMRFSESDKVRLSAIKEILDRGYGKVAQVIQYSADSEKDSMEEMGIDITDKEQLINWINKECDDMGIKFAKRKTIDGEFDEC